jgi:hypothetical protein
VEAGRPKVFGANHTAVQTNRFRGNGKPQAIPSRCLPFSAYSVKRLEYCLKRIFRNPGTMIPDREQCARLRSGPIDLQNNLDIASRPCEADRVANDVFTSASKSMRIGVSENGRTRRLKTYGFAQGLRFEIRIRRHFLDELGEIHVFFLPGRKPGFQA